MEQIKSFQATQLKDFAHFDKMRHFTLEQKSVIQKRKKELGLRVARGFGIPGM